MKEPGVVFKLLPGEHVMHFYVCIASIVIVTVHI